MNSISVGENMTGNSTSQTGQDNDNNHDNNMKRNTIDIVTKDVKGDNANVGAVIGLKYEIIDAKKDFEKFTQKIASHVATNVTMGTYLAPMITNEVEPETSYDKEMEPKALDTADLNDQTKVWKWRDRTKLYLKDRQILKRNNRVVYNIIYGQCSPSIQEVLIGDKDYKDKSDNFDFKWLLGQLRLLSVGLDRTANVYVQNQTAHQTMLNMRQRIDESNQAYLRRFQENVATLELSKGKHVFYTKSDSGKEYETTTADERKSSREKYLAVRFIRRACISRYGNRIEDYEERDAKGIDEYPVTLVGAFNVLISWELIQSKRRSNRPNPYSKPRVSVDEGGETYVHGVHDHGHKLALKKNTTYHRCHKKGHYADKCPERFGPTMI